METFLPTLMSDADVIQRVRDHASNKTTDLGGDVWRESVDSYTSPERFNEEMELFKRVRWCFPRRQQSRSKARM